jgi:hypothetical protein
MAGLQKRDDYTPRRVREQRAYRLVQVGAATGVATVVTVVLAVVGVIAWSIPVVLAVLTGLSAWRFRHITR